MARSSSKFRALGAFGSWALLATIGSSICAGCMLLIADDQGSNPERNRDTLVLRFGTGVGDSRVLKGGWAAMEPWGVWSNMTEAELSIWVGRAKNDIDLELRARGIVPQEVRVAANGEDIGTVQLNNRTAKASVKIAREIAAKQSPLRLVFHVPEMRSPAELGIGADTRKLGIALESATVTY
ncbi:MAG: hypothetical protein WC807_08085 [Hyphomicrobium sp.]